MYTYTLYIYIAYVHVSPFYGGEAKKRRGQKEDAPGWMCANPDLIARLLLLLQCAAPDAFAADPYCCYGREYCIVLDKVHNEEGYARERERERERGYSGYTAQGSQAAV